MKIRSTLKLSIVSSFLISAVIACIALFILQDMKTELERSRIYDEVITKSNAFNVLLATLKEGSSPGALTQMRNVQVSLGGLLNTLSLMKVPEAPLVRLIEKDNEELGLLLARVPASSAGVPLHLEEDRRDVLDSQLWMKVRHISDETYRLRDISRSRIFSAQVHAGVTVFSLLVALIFSNALISMLSGRSVLSAEQALSEQREWFQVTLTSIGDAVLTTDTQGRVTFLNPVAAALTGRRLEDAVGQSVQKVFRIINEKTRAPAENIVERVLRDGNIVGLANHTALVTPNGREIPIEDSAAPIKNRDGGITGVVLVFHDVTERRRATEALRESQTRLDLALRSAQMGVWYLDIDEEKRFYDNLACQLLGIDTVNFTGKAEEFFNAVHPEDRQGVHAALARTIECGAPYETDFRVVRLDGIHYLTARWTLVADDTTQPVRINGLIWDVTERKQAEKALRRYELLAAHSRDIILLMSYEGGGIVEANVAASEAYGYSRAELLELSIYDLRAPDSQPLTKGQIAEADKRGILFETVHKRKDGSTFPVEVSSRGAIIEGRRTLISVVRDITDRKRAEEAMQESRAKLMAALASMTDAVFISDAEGRFVDFNEAFATFHRFKNKDECLMTLAEYPHILDVYMADGQLAPVDMWAVSRALRGEAAVNAEYTLRRKDTGETWVGSYSFGPIRDKDGLIVGSVVAGRDITEHRRMRDELSQSESKFRLLSQTAGNLLASENPQSIVNELCRNVMAYLDCHAFFNFLVEENVGKLRLNAFAGIPDEEGRKIEWLDYGVAVCGCVARDGIRMVAEDIFNTPDARTILVKSYGIKAYACHPLKAGGRLIGTLSFGTKSRPKFSSQELEVMKTVADQVAVAMERIRLIEGLRKSKDELELRVEERTSELKSYMAKLEDSNKALQDFASIASHDLQEPLRKVISFGNMLRRKSDDSLGEAGKDYLERMLEATQRMQSLLNGLLEYSRVTMKADLFAEVELARIVTEVLSDLEIRLKSTGGEVCVGELPIVQADATQMRQLFQNLIGNALKFHKDGEKPIVEIGSVAADDKLQITVKDNGIGFQEKYLDRIFAPFQRLHGRTSQYEGTGMGLAICKKIVERHGGSIIAKSQPGLGAAFIIKLPIRQKLNSSQSTAQVPL